MIAGSRVGKFNHSVVHSLEHHVVIPLFDGHLIVAVIRVREIYI
jgi:hypothetical protein